MGNRKVVLLYMGDMEKFFCPALPWCGNLAQVFKLHKEMHDLCKQSSALCSVIWDLYNKTNSKSWYIWCFWTWAPLFLTLKSIYLFYFKWYMMLSVCCLTDLLTAEMFRKSGRFCCALCCLWYMLMWTCFAGWTGAAAATGQPNFGSFWQCQDC
jgi:hypothetical protein